MYTNVISAGALTAAFIELLKFLWRKFVAKDMSYDFPTMFYTVAIPLLNAVMPFALVLMGIASDDPILTMDALGIVRYLLMIVVSSLVSVATYTAGIKPYNVYAERRAFEKNRFVE